MKLTVTSAGVHCRLRECWVLARNRRISSEDKDWTTEPTIHVLVVESIEVEEPHRRQGRCKEAISGLLRNTNYELIVVEAVQNPILAAALRRWGWDNDEETMDFYHPTTAKT